jgi:hypothetical protein
MTLKVSNHRKWHIFLAFIAIFLPLLIAFLNLTRGNFLFWFDPARDLLSAWNNLSKPTLIGPPSGIPGIFYGPYWIWLLSFGLLFSKNPIYVTLITATIPYFIIFPFVWSRFAKFFDKVTILIGWLLFIFNSGLFYSTHLWNPYPAPLITLVVIYFLLNIDFKAITKKQLLILFLTGFLIGLLINFHLSFGIGFLCGLGIFFIYEIANAFIQNEKAKRLSEILKKIMNFGSLLLGFLISFIPTLLFELRHGFSQTHALLHTFSHYGANVEVQGMSKISILELFFSTFGHFLRLPEFINAIVLLGLIVTLIVFVKKKIIKLTEKDKRILVLLSSLFGGIVLIYFTARNPIWDYHFIGVDVLFLILIAFFSSKFLYVRFILLIATIIIVSVSTVSFIQSTNTVHPVFVEEEQAVKVINADEKSSNYTVYAYSSSIYTYEYAYLFKWLTHKDMPYDPGLIKNPTKVIYLIGTNYDSKEMQNFIHYRSPKKKYKIVKILESSSDVSVVKSIEL